MRIQPKLKVGATYAATAVVVIIALPVLAALAFVARAALFAGLLVAVVGGLVALAVSPRLRAALEDAVEPAMRYKGLPLAGSVGLGDGHAWARVSGRHATLGADGLAQAMLGPVERVELPKPGGYVLAGEPLLRLWRGDRAVALRAPVSGEVMAVNRRLLSDPARLNRDPFHAGWAVRMRLSTPAEVDRKLRFGEAARTWFQREIDHMVGLLQPEPVPVLADGGELSPALHLGIDEATFARMRRELFGTVIGEGLEA
jgi:glycine cleavage system H protein